MANYHLVILKKPYLDAILAGRKTIESRLTRTRHHFFGQVQAGDKLFLKVSSGPVCAAATVAAVKCFENLTPQQIGDIKRRYNHYIQADEQYWQSKADCRFGFLARLKNIEPIEPRQIRKKDWRAWVVLTAKENFGLPFAPGPVPRASPAHILRLCSGHGRQG
jgi:ASC-1-like (ASCH) protein